jgi:hypothetical protein
VDRFLAANDLMRRLANAGCQAASTLFRVVRLAFPELVIEVEATAAK